jgi:hypothetical protein
MAPQVGLVVRRVGDETERLIAHLQSDLAEEARAPATELPPVEGTVIEIEFLDGRPSDAAKRRVRQLLDAERANWIVRARRARPTRRRRTAAHLRRTDREALGLVPPLLVNLRLRDLDEPARQVLESLKP